MKREVKKPVNWFKDLIWETYTFFLWKKCDVCGFEFRREKLWEIIVWPRSKQDKKHPHIVCKHCCPTIEDAIKYREDFYNKRPAPPPPPPPPPQPAIRKLDCIGCKHKKIPPSKPPCDICCAENYKWEPETVDFFDKTCSTCKHIDSASTVEPCVSCLTSDVLFWEYNFNVKTRSTYILFRKCLKHYQHRINVLCRPKTNQ